MSTIGQKSSSCDFCFTGIAVVVLLGQGSWSLAKCTAKEGWQATKTGAHKANRTIWQTANATVYLFEMISAVIFPLLHEIGSLFSNLKTESCRGLLATPAALEEAIESVCWTISPLVEAKQAGLSVAQMTTKAARSVWQGCASMGELIYFITAPFTKEIYQTISLGVEASSKATRSLHNVFHVTKDISEAAFKGIAHELIDQFIIALEMSFRTGRAAKHSIESGLIISKESAYCFFLEAAATCGVGYHECFKALASLPPVLQAFLQMPFEGIAALLEECKNTLYDGSHEVKRTFKSAHYAVNSGIDFLKITLLGFVEESFFLGKEGIEMPQKTARALAYAIDHGTEAVRSLLFSILLESGATLSSGMFSSCRAIRAFHGGVLQGAEMVAKPCIALLKEFAATLCVACDSTVKTLYGTVHALDTATSPLQNLAKRSGVEVIYSLGVLGHQFCASMRALKQSSQRDGEIYGEWSLRSIYEIGEVALQGLKEISRFNYQMSHEAPRSLNVFVFYPLKRSIHSRTQKIQATWHLITARVNAILATFRLA